MLFNCCKIIILYLLIFSLKANASENSGNLLDSLKKKLIITTSDSIRCRLLNEISTIYRVAGIDSAEIFAQQAFEIAVQRKDMKALAAIYLNKGIIHHNKGNYEQAKKFYLQCMKAAEEAEDQFLIARAHTMLGESNRILENYSKAEIHFTEALNIFLTIGERGWAAWTYNDLANVTYNRDSALMLYDKAIRLGKESGHHYAIVDAYHNSGGIYLGRKEYEKALYFFLSSLRLEEKYGFTVELAGSYEQIAVLYMRLGQYKLSEEYLQKALRIAVETSAKAYLNNVYETYAELMERQEHFQEAYRYFKLHHYYNDSLFNAEKTRQMAEMEAKYENEKQQLKIQNLEKEKIFRDLELVQKNFQRNMILGGFVLMLLFAVFVFNRFRITRNHKKIIEQQKSIVEGAHAALKEKNNDIISSIHYALRIQSATLPSRSEFMHFLPESFVIFKPKDIVAGDFYWLEAIGTKVFFAAADCTGHGVPGAMVSVMCSNALTKAVKELGIFEPGKILDKAAEILEERFAKSEEIVNDGMDVALCSLDLKTRKLEYSGANNPLYFIREEELREIKADKQPIGQFENRQPFTNHTIELQKGDTIYIFSDGYADQFGGPKGKKFKYAQLKELLLENAYKPMVEQKNILDKAFEQWKAWPTPEGGVRELEQVDDVCIIGVRI